MQLSFDDNRRESHRTRRICGETRPTRLHYQLRCHLPAEHAGEHKWTPELVPVARSTSDLAQLRADRTGR